MLRPLILLAAALTLAAPVLARDEQPLFVPVLEDNFPDPFILPVGQEFLGYATNADGGRANVQMASSTDLTHWKMVRDGVHLHDAMPVMPPWARSGSTWAPEVIAAGGGYVLHFTAKERQSGLQCLGAAFSTDPRGPFRSDATEPLVCQRELGGTIDSDVFRDADGQLYLYYKNDGNNPKFRQPTQIFVQRLTPDGLHVSGDATPLARNDQPWEAHVIEAPTMVRHQGRYTLFYSANHYGWEPDQNISVYAIGYATCRGPLGPCTDAADNPVLHSFNDTHAGCLSGPGHQAVFEVGAHQVIAFHAWAASRDCHLATPAHRQLYLAPLGWDGDRPVIGRSLRPAPR
jgi:beta-xylosidase